MYISTHYHIRFRANPSSGRCLDQVSALLDEILATHCVDTTCLQIDIVYLYLHQVEGYTQHRPNHPCVDQVSALLDEILATHCVDVSL